MAFTLRATDKLLFTDDSFRIQLCMKWNIVETNQSVPQISFKWIYHWSLLYIIWGWKSEMTKYYHLFLPYHDLHMVYHIRHFVNLKWMDELHFSLPLWGRGLTLIKSFRTAWWMKLFVSRLGPACAVSPEAVSILKKLCYGCVASLVSLKALCVWEVE